VYAAVVIVTLPTLVAILAAWWTIDVHGDPWPEMDAGR
jgi:hypothetical protein